MMMYCCDVLLINMYVLCMWILVSFMLFENGGSMLCVGEVWVDEDVVIEGCVVIVFVSMVNRRVEKIFVEGVVILE